MYAIALPITHFFFVLSSTPQIIGGVIYHAANDNREDIRMWHTFTNTLLHVFATVTSMRFKARLEEEEKITKEKK